MLVQHDMSYTCIRMYAYAIDRVCAQQNFIHSVAWLSLICRASLRCQGYLFLSIYPKPEPAPAASTRLRGEVLKFLNEMQTLQASDTLYRRLT